MGLATPTPQKPRQGTLVKTPETNPLLENDMELIAAIRDASRAYDGTRIDTPTAKSVLAAVLAQHPETKPDELLPKVEEYLAFHGR
jgi:hypothetical protein